MKTILVTLLSLTACNACGASDKRAAAASGYAAQQAECIANNKTREAIDACRDKVKTAWSSDAGAEGGAK